MTELRNKMKVYMELKGYSPKTTKNYLIHISNLAKYYNKSPDLLYEKEICGYLHYCITERHLTEGSLGSIYNAFKIFYTKVLGRVWDVNKIPRTKDRRRLPVVLSTQEVKAIFDATEDLKYKTIFMTIYSAGLRVSEACNLKITDIDSKNMQIFIRQGKGKKDRYTLLSVANLEILREYWKRYKPSDFLFTGRYRSDALTARSVQKVFEKSKQLSRVTKNATVHTLRHSFATHLLDAGVDICYIQRLMGHTRITTTTIYLHLRRMDLLNIKSPLDILMGKGND
jgi:site-specific recombinase XerD